MEKKISISDIVRVFSGSDPDPELFEAYQKQRSEPSSEVGQLFASLNGLVDEPSVPQPPAESVKDKPLEKLDTAFASRLDRPKTDLGSPSEHSSKGRKL